MKGNKKLLVVAILLLLIAVSYGTYAIYKTAASADAEAKIALWNVEFQDDGTEITGDYTIEFTEADCTNNHVATGYIAPGATCTKEITLVATGTQVDVEYTVEADEDNIKVNGAAPSEDANEFSASITGADGHIYMSESQTETFNVVLEWGSEEGSPFDAADTTIGEHGGSDGWTVTVPVTLVAKQMIGS